MFLVALEDAAVTLEAGVLEAAVEKMQTVDLARERAQRANAAFSAAELSKARALEQRCQLGWTALQTSLVGHLQQTGVTRRALGAYGAHGGQVRVA